LGASGTILGGSDQESNGLDQCPQEDGRPLLADDPAHVRISGCD
jgi:hypothetical protein